jgi:O-antigen/teichoic acid export membrane protein
MTKATMLSGIFNKLRKPEGSLTGRAFVGSFWLFALRGTYEAFYLIRIVIIARILAPRDFGLLGIALLVVGTVETFSTTGFHDALIQRKETSKAELDIAWSLMIIRGAVLFLILYFAAPLAAGFFREPNSVMVIRLIALTSLLQGFNNVGIVLFRKELEFYKQFLYQFVGVVADFAVSVSLAFILRNVLALVFGLVVGQLALCVMSYVLCPYQPSFRLQRKRIRELFHFGKWVLGSTILLFLILQGDGFFVGKFLGVTLLGLYQMANKISNTPATELTHIISQVAFPVYAKLQDESVRLREAYLRIIQLIAFLSFPLAAFIFSLSPDFTRIFLGEKWMPMVPAMKVLAVAGLFRALGATGGPVFYGLGKPKLDTQINALRLVVMATLLYPLSIRWGIVGTAAAVLCSVVLATLGFLTLSQRLTGCRPRDYIRVFLFPVVGGFAVMAAIKGCQAIGSHGIVGFFLTALAGLIVYLALALVWEKRFDYQISFFLREGMLLINGS